MEEEDDLDSIFETEGNIEDFKDEQGNEGDDADLEDLLALVEEEKEEEENIAQDEESILEDEYRELQRKMEKLKEKMQQKQKSPDASKTDDKSGPSSFLAAFGSVPVAKDVTPDTPVLPPKCKSNPPTKNAESSNATKKRRAESTETENPQQKRRRLAHATAGASSAEGHPFTQSLRNSINGGTVEIPRGQQKAVDKKPSKSQSESTVVEIEHFSRLRLRKSFVPAEEMKDRMQGKRFLKLSLIRSTMKISEDTDWVTIGVVAKQLERQSSKNGKAFTIWNLTDLDDCTKSVTFFLFGKVHDKLSKQVTVGSVVGVLNPEIMPPKNDMSGNNSDNTPALTVDVPERVMIVGIAADLGWCTAVKYRNKKPAGKCLAFINKQISDTCVFHMRTKYKKMGAKRGELQGSVAPPVAQKYKDTLWNKVKNDQFFYGGKVYSASPTAMTGPAKLKEPKVKLSKFLSNHAGLSAEMKKELTEKSKVIKALSGMDEVQSVSGCSDTFSDMLASGDNVAGSRQYLNHLKKMQLEEEEKKKDKSGKPLTAAEVLRQQSKVIETAKKKGLIQQKLNELKHQSSPKIQSPGNKFVTAADIKRQTAELIKLKKLEFSSKSGTSSHTPSKPSLGQGLSKEKDFDLFGDWLKAPVRTSAPNSPNPELMKRKAIAKLRNDDGKVQIKKNNPNTGVLRQISNVRGNEKLQSKIRGKVQREEVAPAEKNRENVRVEKVSTGKMSEEELQKIINARSSHSDVVEEARLEEQEKYFNPLIKKEMMEQKMAETYEVTSKVVTCRECSYTFWGPHERCKTLQHHLNWHTAKKKFFQCSHCKQRTTTWETYPSRACTECGSVKNWQRTSMLREKDSKILDTEILLIRGLEHGKFLNSIK